MGIATVEDGRPRFELLVALGSRAAMDLSLFFAGTAGSVPTARRGLPALLLRAGGDRLLFDCGEGTQQQLLRSVGLPELDAIFITHYHLDHWLGLLGMLKTFDLRGRERPLTVYGPPGLQGAARRDAPGVGAGRATRSRSRSSTRTRRSPSTATSIAPFPVEHRVPAYGYAFAEDDRPGRFDAEAADAARASRPAPTSAACSAARPSAACAPEQVRGRAAAAAAAS